MTPLRTIGACHAEWLYIQRSDRGKRKPSLGHREVRARSCRERGEQPLGRVRDALHALECALDLANGLGQSSERVRARRAARPSCALEERGSNGEEELGSACARIAAHV